MQNTAVKLLVVMLLLMSGLAEEASAQETKIKWFGHAAFSITTPRGKVLLIDGGHFGMEPKMAARAAQSVRARLSVPQHFGTFPGIAPNADAFVAELKKLKLNFYQMKPGETITYRGNQLIKSK